MHALIEKAIREGRHLLEPEALKILRDYGIAVPQHAFVETEEEAKKAAQSLGWPVVLKIVSPDVLHKTEVGGVFLDIRNVQGVAKAFRQLKALEKEGLRVSGILVSPFHPPDMELLVGMVRDPQFGPVITFGLGGIWVEIYRDVTYGIAPLSPEESMEMIEGIKAFPLLQGQRGQKGVDLIALSDLLVRFSRIALEETALEAVDLNPVFPLERGYFIADSRFLLREPAFPATFGETPRRVGGSGFL